MDMQSRDISTTRQLAAVLRADHSHDSRALNGEMSSVLARAAIQQGLAGILLRALARHELALSTPSHEALSRQAALIAARNLAMMAELERALLALNRIGVPVMLLKGAALQLTLYQRRDLRPMGDLDLMIRPCDTARTLQALDAIGYTRGADLVRDDFFPKYYYETELISPPPNRVRVDLHVRPFRPLRLTQTVPESAFWDESQTLRCGDSSAQVPNAESMLIHLAAHAAYHGCSRLLWLYDIHDLAATYADSVDWSKVVSLARQWNLGLPVHQGLAQTESYFGRTVPDDVLEELRSIGAGWRDRLTLWQAPRDAARPMAHVLVNWVCTPGFRFSTGYLLAHLLPGEAHLAECYRRRHRGWRACALALRVLRATWRACVAPIRKLLGGIARRATPTPHAHPAKA